MRMVMDMETGMFAAESSDDPQTYGTEVLCANWNPLVTMVAEVMPHHDQQPALPLDLVGEDADAFISRMSVC
ncbi:MAG: hypothetical protein AB1513_06525 [Pseudomonadota bacterium]